MRVLRIDDSTNVTEVCYDTKKQHLVVTFSGGGRYRYEHVQPHQFGELSAAPSVGKYVNSVFVRKTEAHPCTRLDGDQEDTTQELRLKDRLEASLDPMRVALERIRDYKSDGGGRVELQEIAREALDAAKNQEDGLRRALARICGDEFTGMGDSNALTRALEMQEIARKALGYV